MVNPGFGACSVVGSRSTRSPGTCA
jgi:hypothetical protein